MGAVHGFSLQGAAQGSCGRTSSAAETVSGKLKRKLVMRGLELCRAAVPTLTFHVPNSV